MDSSGQAASGTVGQGVGIRAGATLIDIVIFWVISFIVAIFTGETSSAGFAVGTLGTCLIGIISIAYYVVMETMYGGTVGKLALGLKVVKEDGSALDWQTSIIRTLLRIIDGLFFYLIAAILAGPRQRNSDSVTRSPRRWLSRRTRRWVSGHQRHGSNGFRIVAHLTP